MPTAPTTAIKLRIARRRDRIERTKPHVKIRERKQAKGYQVQVVDHKTRIILWRGETVRAALRYSKARRFHIVERP